MLRHRRSSAEDAATMTMARRTACSPLSVPLIAWVLVARKHPSRRRLNRPSRSAKARSGEAAVRFLPEVKGSAWQVAASRDERSTDVANRDVALKCQSRDSIRREPASHETRAHRTCSESATRGILPNPAICIGCLGLTAADAWAIHRLERLTKQERSRHCGTCTDQDKD